MHRVLAGVLDAPTDAIAQIEDAGLSIVAKDGRLHSLGLSHGIVDEVLNLQADLREGPSVDALVTGLSVVADDVETERRWSRYVPVALALGVRSELAVPLVYEGSVLGELTLCWTTPHPLDIATLALVEGFADQAAVTLGATDRANKPERRLLTRQVIGQAIGILMERFDLDAESALAYLRHVSSTRNMKLRDIAVELTRTGEVPPAHSMMSSWP